VPEVSAALDARAGLAPRGGIRPDLLAERLVDVNQHLLLPLSDLGVSLDRIGDRRLALFIVQDSRLHIERFRRDPQAFGDLLQKVRAGLPQAALNLAEVRARDAGRLGKLPHRDLRLLALLADVRPDRADVHRTHTSSLTSDACNCKSPSKHSGRSRLPPI